MIRTLTISLFAIGLTACGGPGENATVPQAEPAGATSADIGEHVVHFNAQTTDQLSPEIASKYNIVRSKNRAMLSVSVLKKADRTPTTAAVSVQTVNLTGQLKSVTLREIREPGDVVAIYYIGDTAVTNRETLVFNITVKPDGAEFPSELRFKREFYTD